MYPQPLVTPLLLSLNPAEVWRRLVDRPHVLFLDSATPGGDRGRYSFVTADPFAYLEVPVSDADVLPQLAAEWNRWPATTVPGLPPFQGGAAGVFAYELGRSLERLPAPPHDEFGFPALAVGLYDVVVAFDHQQREAWIVSHGFPATTETARRTRAEERRNQFLSWLARPESAVPRPLPVASGPPPLSRSDLAPQYPVPGAIGLTSNFTHAGYLEAVRCAVEYIRAGDIFQVNLSQRLLCPATTDAVTLYQRLRQRNPAPFAGYFDTGTFQVVSASPERFIQVRGRQVEARPIKGTRRRSRSPEADLFTGDELLASEKDRAENVMIVDLLRNDLSSVCLPDSVRVTQLCGLEVYEYVQHLVSVVRGELAAEQSPLSLLSRAFPGGSITGAPKVRAMEIIAELEPTARGPYCGSLGYLGFDGTLDLSILIRTITAGRGWWQFPVGGGIVAPSDPQREYEETWHKAAGLLRALTD
ncbi:MAG: anthranilate synthase component I family protein [Pirellulales bacterium]